MPADARRSAARAALTDPLEDALHRLGRHAAALVARRRTDGPPAGLPVGRRVDEIGAGLDGLELDDGDLVVGREAVREVLRMPAGTHVTLGRAAEHLPPALLAL